MKKCMLLLSPYADEVYMNSYAIENGFEVVGRINYLDVVDNIDLVLAIATEFNINTILFDNILSLLYENYTGEDIVKLVRETGITLIRVHSENKNIMYAYSSKIEKNIIKRLVEQKNYDANIYALFVEIDKSLFQSSIDKCNLFKSQNYVVALAMQYDVQTIYILKNENILDRDFMISLLYDAFINDIVIHPLTL